MDKILFTGGSSLVIAGEWKSGDPFDDDSSVTALLAFATKEPRAEYACTVTVVPGTRDFEIYASNSATGQWPKGTHTMTLTRTESNVFPNGDPFVEVLEPFQVEVR